jgi:hypothetical protein
MWVKVVGIVVAIDEWSGCRIYTIDDSSGATIECVMNIPKNPRSLPSTTKADDAELEESKATVAAVQTTSTKEDKRAAVDSDVDVGDCIHVTGCIIQAKWARKIKVSKIIHLRSTAEEVMFWDKLAKFYKDVLSQPWILTEKEIRRSRKQAKEEPEETEGKQPVKQSKRKSRETGLKPKRLTKIVASDQRGNLKRRSTGLGQTSKQPETARVADGTALRLDTEQPTSEVTLEPDAGMTAKHKATGLEATVRPSNRVVTIENTGATSLRTSNAVNEQIPDPPTSKRIKRTGLERTRERPRTIQTGATFATGLDTMVHTVEESLLEADTTVAAKTRATGSEPVSKRPKIVRTSTGVGSPREVPDEVRALDTQTASRRRVTGLERRSRRLASTPVERI